jgi:hypothetical protein
MTQGSGRGGDFGRRQEQGHKAMLVVNENSCAKVSA